ncbi:hypothetical protein F383_12789 [Gossypium arboreum]|uniref:Uncharacterized protein n=1 Tax=Gossypium arboreum TaxID=29729 RepID=A0A0B0MQD0_GOSAR|nr:hypothetical protein F383_23946 [Gossypium arboreum]KHG11791.1 hypothetical protein F383_12789 [Gossypium arboreum]
MHNLISRVPKQPKSIEKISALFICSLFEDHGYFLKM